MFEYNNNNLSFSHKKFIGFMINCLIITIFTFIQSYMVLVEIIIHNNYFLLLEFLFNDKFFFNNKNINCFFI